MASSSPLLFLLAALPLGGCSVYHKRVFAKQDQQGAAAEPYLLDTAPEDAAAAHASGRFVGVDKRSGNTGEVSLHRSPGGTVYVHIADWTALEAPDLYFYIGAEPVAAGVFDKAALRDPARAVKLTANNLRPSNLGFAGEDVWFRAPEGFEDAGAVYIYCYKFNELFAAAALE